MIEIFCTAQYVHAPFPARPKLCTLGGLSVQIRAVQNKADKVYIIINTPAHASVISLFYSRKQVAPSLLIHKATKQLKFLIILLSYVQRTLWPSQCYKKNH